MKTKTYSFPIDESERILLKDALEILSPCDDTAESLRIHLLDRLASLPNLPRK